MIVAVLTMDKPDLLAALLSVQIEDGSGDAFDPELALKCLRTGQPLSAAYKALLLRSPVARLKLREAIKRDDLELKRQAQTFDVGLMVTPLAAASDEQMVTINAIGWKLIIFKENLPHATYSLTLQLDHQLKSIAPKRVKVVDSGGLLWLNGKPDSRAELTVEWSYTDFTPMERLSNHSLQLELISV